MTLQEKFNIWLDIVNEKNERVPPTLKQRATQIRTVMVYLTLLGIINQETGESS